MSNLPLVMLDDPGWTLLIHLRNFVALSTDTVRPVPEVLSVSA
jgi:hypothetical protein